MKSIDILAVGGAGLDTVVALDRLPSHDEKIIGRFVGYTPGGPASNFACAASRLGLRATVLATVGDDEAGRRIVADFERHGVDTSLIQVTQGGISNFTVCMIDPSGEKAVVVVPMLAEHVSLDVAREEFLRTRLVFGMPNDREQFGQLARVAHECGAEVMIDVEASVVPDPPDMARFLTDVDIVAFNRDSFLGATGEEPGITAARALLTFGPRLVIVTLGAGGSLAVTAGDHADAAAFPVDVVDTTGASDTFNAAFVKAMFDGKPMPERLRFANAAAALAVTAFGSRGRLPSEEEVEDFLRSTRPHDRDRRAIA